MPSYDLFYELTQNKKATIRAKNSHEAVQTLLERLNKEYSQVGITPDNAPSVEIYQVVENED